MLYYIILYYIYIIYINLVIATCEIICEDFGNKQHLSQSQLDFLRIDEDFNMAHTHIYIYIYIYVYQLYYISIFDIYSIYIYKNNVRSYTHIIFPVTKIAAASPFASLIELGLG